MVVFFTALTASAGWIMVQSGLVDRPWVNAYKLTLHFILAILSIGALVKTIADVYNYKNIELKPTNRFILVLIFITFIQMIFAGLMSGMRAGLFYPSWPDMNGHFIPDVLLTTSNWNWINLTNYDKFVFAPALVQFIHRLLAYVLLFLTIFLFFKYRSKVHKIAKFWLNTSFVLIILQLFLGVLTVINANAGIPLFYGVSHQLVGLLFLISLLFLHYSLRNKIV